MRELWRGLVDLLIPPACAACGASHEGSALCARCDAALVRLAEPGCRRCQRPISGCRTCAACAASPSPLESCTAAAAYDGEVERWIRRFKYPRRGLAGLDPAAPAVVTMLVREAARRSPGETPDWIVPIPLHRRRLRSRGFNPAAILARALTREGPVRFAPLALERIRDTPSQTGLDRRERRRNVRGAFRLRSGIAPPPRVWLVDDVVTTGSTLEEAARVLRRGGTHEVAAVCAARTPEPTPKPSSD